MQKKHLNLLLMFTSIFIYSLTTFGATPLDPLFLDIRDKDLHILVNKTNKLSSTYYPSDLVVPQVAFSYNGILEKSYLRSDAAVALEELFDAALEDNIYLYAVSGFRSYDRQSQIYQNNILVQGEEFANKVSAKPGHSEHQTGLTMDVSSQSVGYMLTQSFGLTKEGIWLEENAHKYGFIIRYPEDKEHITGYIYEPWHLRFVGVTLATYLYEHNIVLEELVSCHGVYYYVPTAKVYSPELYNTFDLANTTLILDYNDILYIPLLDADFTQQLNSQYIFSTIAPGLRHVHFPVSSFKLINEQLHITSEAAHTYLIGSSK